MIKFWLPIPIYGIFAIKKKINASLLSAELSISEITSCYEFANCIFEKDNFKKNDFDFVEFFRVYYWELFYEYKCLDIFFKKKII